MRVQIVGGMSFPRSISLLTDTHKATARYSEQGITTTLQQRPPLTRFISSRDLPIPQTLKLLLFLFDNYGLVGRAVMLGVLVLFATSVNPLFAMRGPVAPIPWWMYVLAWGPYVVFPFWIYFAVGRWHAAEHMAIAAYDRSGATDIESFRHESRIDERCGGRFVLPLLLSSYVSSYLVIMYGLNYLVALLLPIELLLWLDKVPAWRNAWFIQLPSMLLQRYVTTREPTDRELNTARAALLRLTELHNA